MFFEIASFAGVVSSSAPTAIDHARAQNFGGERSVTSSASMPRGQWEIVNSPNPSTLYNFLVKLTCVSADDCWAVGSYWAGNHDQALIEHYDGTSWLIVASPSPGPTSSSYLAGIACLNTNDCWAVGSYSAASTGTIGFGNFPVGDQPLIEHWDGTAWSVAINPPGPPESILHGVSCTSANDCWAVGHYGAEVIQTYTEHYDGVAWTIVPSPNQSSPTNALYAVTCNSSSDCWAVGQFFNTVPATCGQNQTVSIESLVQHYDGTAWSIVNAPYDPCRYNLLDKVTCLNGADCWAVGTKSTDTSSQSTLIQHYDGNAWSIVDSPNTDPVLINYLYGVTCASANDCWATGLHDIGGTNYRPMIQHFDGAVWAVVDNPVPDTTYRLDDVTCITGNNCWAVGTDSQGHTFIEHYTVPVQLNAVVSRMTHGNSGMFDVNLTNGNAIECRRTGSNGDYTLVFSFAGTLENVTDAAVTSGVGSISSANIDPNDAHNYIINLIGVGNAQVVTVSLNKVTDSAGDFSGAISASMTVLTGDTNGDGVVNSADIGQTKSQSGNVVTGSNFREDLNGDGVINSADIGLVKSKSGTALP